MLLPTLFQHLNQHIHPNNTLFMSVILGLMSVFGAIFIRTPIKLGLRIRMINNWPSQGTDTSGRESQRIHAKEFVKIVIYPLPIISSRPGSRNDFVCDLELSDLFMEFLKCF